MFSFKKKRRSKSLGKKLVLFAAFVRFCFEHIHLNRCVTAYTLNMSSKIYSNQKKIKANKQFPGQKFNISNRPPFQPLFERYNSFTFN